MLFVPRHLWSVLKCSCRVLATSGFLICVRCLENLLFRDCEVCPTYCFFAFFALYKIDYIPCIAVRFAVGVKHPSGFSTSDLRGVQEFVVQWTVFIVARSCDASFSKSGNLMIEVGQVSDMCIWVCV